MTLQVRPHITESITSSTNNVFDKLKRASGNFTSFVLMRVVRLTVETNTLTGTCSRETSHRRASNSLFSRLSYYDPGTLCRLSRK